MASLFNQQLRQRFELQAQERFSRIEERFQDQEQRLDSLRRFFANSAGVFEREFHGYAEALLHRPQAFAWAPRVRSEEHTSELQSLITISYALFCLKKKNTTNT